MINNKQQLSKMSEADYYAPGSYHDPSAPWNQVEVPEKDFDITISQSLSKDATVCTNDYSPEYDDEDGSTYANTDNTDWPKAYEEEHYTPLQLIQKLKEYCEEEVMYLMEGKNVSDLSSVEKNQKRKYEHLIEECMGWTDDETEIFGS